MRRLIRIIRNVALLLIAAILVLAGVLAFNVLSRTSQQLQVASGGRPAGRGGSAERGDPRPHPFEFRKSGSEQRGAARLAGAHLEKFSRLSCRSQSRGDRAV